MKTVFVIGRVWDGSFRDPADRQAEVDGATGFTYVTRKNRRNDPNRLVLRKYDPVLRRHVEFREER